MPCQFQEAGTFRGPALSFLAGLNISSVLPGPDFLGDFGCSAVGGLVSSPTGCLFGWFAES